MDHHRNTWGGSYSQPWSYSQQYKRSRGGGGNFDYESESLGSYRHSYEDCYESGPPAKRRSYNTWPAKQQYEHNPNRGGYHKFSSGGAYQTSGAYHHAVVGDSYSFRFSYNPRYCDSYHYPPQTSYSAGGAKLSREYLHDSGMDSTASCSGSIQHSGGEGWYGKTGSAACLISGSCDLGAGLNRNDDVESEVGGNIDADDNVDDSDEEEMEPPNEGDQETFSQPGGVQGIRGEKETEPDPLADHGFVPSKKYRIMPSHAVLKSPMMDGVEPEENPDPRAFSLMYSCDYCPVFSPEAAKIQKHLRFSQHFSASKVLVYVTAGRSHAIAYINKSLAQLKVPQSFIKKVAICPECHEYFPMIFDAAEHYTLQHDRDCSPGLYSIADVKFKDKVTLNSTTFLTDLESGRIHIPQVHVKANQCVYYVCRFCDMGKNDLNLAIIHMTENHSDMLAQCSSLFLRIIKVEIQGVSHKMLPKINKPPGGYMPPGTLGHNITPPDTYSAPGPDPFASPQLLAYMKDGITYLQQLNEQIKKCRPPGFDPMRNVWFRKRVLGITDEGAEREKKRAKNKRRQDKIKHHKAKQRAKNIRKMMKNTGTWN